MQLRRLVVMGALAALCLVGCKREESGAGAGGGGKSASAKAGVGGMGTLLAPGLASDLRVTPDGHAHRTAA